MKLLVIINPQARSGRARNLLPALRSVFESHDVNPEFTQTKKKGDATELAANVQPGEYDAVVAAGGDGTVFEVLNGIFSHPTDKRPCLGVIPMGTGNAFAREFDLFPQNWKEAVKRICKGRSRPVDVGEILSGEDRFYFLNIAGLGFATGAGLKARKLKFIGNTAYTLGTLWETIGLRSYRLKIKLDGREVEQANVMVEVSNSRYTGTSFLIAPEALVDDGYLDVTLLRQLSRTRLLRLFPTIYSGRHVQFDEIETYRAKEIEIDGPAGMRLTVDGEFRGSTPARIRCLPKALMLLV